DAGRPGHFELCFAGVRHRFPFGKERPMLLAGGEAWLIVPLIVQATIGFILGDLIGLVPAFLARWRQRTAMAVLSVLLCGLAGAIYLPAAAVVAALFCVAALVMGRWDQNRELEREAAAYRRNEGDAGD